METIYKLQPNRTMHLQGVNAYGAAAALWGATETGFTVSGTFRDPADFAVLVLWDRDDFYGHPRWSYLPDEHFEGLALDFDVTFEGVFPFESKKPAWTDCASLNARLANSTTEEREPLIQLATGPSGRTGASGTFTLKAGTQTCAGDRATLWYQNLAFDYWASGGETTESICENLATQINQIDWTRNGPLALSATAAGNQITISAEPGSDGNMVTLYELHGNQNLYFEPAVVRLQGGDSDRVSWHVHADFSALNWTQIDRLCLTFAPALANGSNYTATDWKVVVSNWTVVDPNGVRPLKVAGPNSVRIEEDDAWVTYDGYWEQAPEATGVFSQGRALRAAQPGATATVETHCGSAHDIYLGTRFDVDCGFVDVLLDGVASPAGPLDCYRPAELAQSRVRRKVFNNVPAGAYTLQIRIKGTTSGQGTYYYFDFVECVVPSDVPDAPEVRTNVALATDFDTDHTYKMSPQRLLWAIQKSGLCGTLDHYAGVFWWKEARRAGGSIPGIQISCDTSADAFLTIGDWTIGKTIYPTDTPETVAAHFKYFINAAAAGVWADTDGNGMLQIYCRSADFAYPCTVSGGAHIVGGALTGGSAPVWEIDADADAIFNRAFSDWHADFFSTLRVAGMDAIVAFSQELVQAPDNPPDAVWYQRFPDGTAVSTATGFQSLYSSQCAFSSVVQTYARRAYEAMASLMENAGLPARLQFGEILWWFAPLPAPSAEFPFYAAGNGHAHFLRVNQTNYSYIEQNPAGDSSADVANALVRKINSGPDPFVSASIGSQPYIVRVAQKIPGTVTLSADNGACSLQYEGGMAYYDADTASDFESTYGRPLTRFSGPNDDPNVNGAVDATFLQSRLLGYVRGIQDYVRAAHPDVQFELLWPLDVNAPESKRLNWFVNLPPVWKQKDGSGFSSFLCEGFQFAGIDRNVDEVSRCAAYPFKELAWSPDDCGYLMGLFNAGWPWEREFKVGQQQPTSVVKIWAYDHVCMYGRCIPLPKDARTSAILP